MSSDVEKAVSGAPEGKWWRAILPVRHRPFFLLYCVTFIVGFGQSMMFSILPPVARATGLDETQVGTIFALPSLAFLICSPLWGRASDRFGRKPILLIGIVAYGLSVVVVGIGVQLGLSGAISVTAMFVVLIFSRSINGVFGSGAMPSGQAYIADRTGYAERTSVLATFQAGNGVGTVFGPAAGAFLVLVTFYTPFYFVAAWAGVLAILVWKFLEPDDAAWLSAAATGSKRPWFSPFDRRVAVFFSMIVASSFVIATIMQTISFYVMDTLRLTPDVASRYAGAALVGIAVSQLVVQLFLIPRFSLTPARLIPLGAMFGVVGLAVFLSSTFFPVMFLAMCIMGFALAMLTTGLIAACSLSVGSDEQGGVAGAIGSVFPIGFVISPLTIMPLYKIVPQLPYLVDLVLMVALAVVALRHRRVRFVGASMPD